LHELPGPAPEPGGGLVVQFEPAPDPGGGLMVQFGSAPLPARYPRTVVRLTPNSRAIRRCDHPRLCNVSIEVTIAILSRFATCKLLCDSRCGNPRACLTTNHFPQVAQLHPPLTGTLCPPDDRRRRETWRRHGGWSTITAGRTERWATCPRRNTPPAARPLRTPLRSALRGLAAGR